jgi:hypothetical protein
MVGNTGGPASSYPSAPTTVDQDPAGPFPGTATATVTGPSGPRPMSERRARAGMMTAAGPGSGGAGGLGDHSSHDRVAGATTGPTQ